MEYYTGDKVYVKKLWSNVFTATVISTHEGVFFTKYLCEWYVNSRDYGVEYRKVGFVYSWNIIGYAKHNSHI